MPSITSGLQPWLHPWLFEEHGPEIYFVIMILRLSIETLLFLNSDMTS